LPPQDAALRIVHAGGRFVVVDKPPGMLSVPGKGPDKADCVASRVAAIFPAATGPFIVHRLDMETSGLMVLGLDPDAQRELSGQFEARTVEKIYVALVVGILTRDAGTIDLPIRPDPARRPLQVVDPVQGRSAVTGWRALARETDRTRVEFRPITGRTHQIRVHAAAPEPIGGLGSPILGDVLYGSDTPSPRLMLHAALLSFRAPGGVARVEFRSPPAF
jgi:tRNA pseudouridine32 synthase/23S rRNA pseudouridine746 synthase